MKYVPNIVTSTRFVFALLLVFSEPLSMLFWIFYGLGAATDLIDGLLARRLKVNNNFGSTFDTIADFFFVICIMICMFPILDMSIQSYILIGLVFLFKAISLTYAYIRFKKMVSYHTYIIKFSFFIIILFPVWTLLLDENLIVIFMAALQIGAYIEEFFITRASDIPDENAKSLYHLRKAKQ